MLMKKITAEDTLTGKFVTKNRTEKRITKGVQFGHDGKAILNQHC